MTAFYRNARYLPPRRNGNALYHEIVSLPRWVGVNVEWQAEVLFDLAHRYLDERAPGNVVYGRLHKEEHHLHVHLILSSNEWRGDRRVRLSRDDFLRIQRKMERYRIQTYPELGSRVLYGPESTSPQKKPRQALIEVLSEEIAIAQ